MVIVGDDCALPPPRGIAGRRGLAGTILVHKVFYCSNVFSILDFPLSFILSYWHVTFFHSAKLTCKNLFNTHLICFFMQPAFSL